MRHLGFAATLLAAFAGFADEAVWTGATDGNWDTVTANWLKSGAEGTFAVGDDVRFDDQGQQKTVTVVGNLEAGKVVFSNDTDYVLAGGGASQTQSTTQGLYGKTSLEKTGAGKLTITGFHSYAGDLIVREGTVAASTGKGDCGNARNSPFGDLRSERTWLVLTNATLDLRGTQGLTGAGNSGDKVKAQLEVHGGTVNFCETFMNALGNAWFDDATINYSNGLSEVWRCLAFYGEWVKFTGRTPYVFPLYGDAARGSCGLMMGHVSPTEVYVEDITGNADIDVNFQLPVVRVDRAGSAGSNGSFKKTGPGRLNLASAFNTITGDVEVAEGELSMNGNRAALDAVTSCFGRTDIAHTFKVDPGATLHLTASDLNGQFYKETKTAIHVKGGTFSQQNGLVNGLGPVIFENAKIDFSGYASWGYNVVDGTVTNYVSGVWPTLGFTDVTFKGTNAYNLSRLNNSNLAFGQCGTPGVIRVEEITGDAKDDVTLDVPIIDSPLWAACRDGILVSTNHPGVVSSLRKTGPGTLYLKNNSSTFTGDVIVEGGVLSLGVRGNQEEPASGPLGNFRSGLKRTVTVCNGAELRYNATDTFGQLSALMLNTTFVISNATVRLLDTTSNGLPDLKLYDAKLIYDRGLYDYGSFAFNGSVEFDGTKPYVFPVSKIADSQDNSCRLGLGWLSDLEVTQANGREVWNGKTEMYVKDITGDAEPDVTFEVQLYKRTRWAGTTLYKDVDIVAGLLKTGPGTLRLAHPNNSYPGGTRVAEGTLQLDGVLASSAVTVNGGAYLSGTGSVTTVTMDDGSGFFARVGSTGVRVTKSLTLPDSGTVNVDIANPDNLPVEELRATLVQGVQSVPADLNWNVTVDGVAAPQMKVRLAGGKLTCRYPTGLILLVR